MSLNLNMMTWIRGVLSKTDFQGFQVRTNSSIANQIIFDKKILRGKRRFFEWNVNGLRQNTLIELKTLRDHT